MNNRVGGAHPARINWLVALALAVTIGVLASAVPEPARAEGPKILVVMSYHEEYAWCQELKQGIESGFPATARLKYYYLDMKRSPQHGAAKAQEAFELYRSWRPDLVIAADDYAQSAFVVPYLKEKVTTPVIFCGVNDDPRGYGYPASNVTGVLEFFRTKETLALLKRLAPTVRNVCVIMRGNEPTTDGVFQQMKSEANSYTLKVLLFRKANGLEEAVAIAEEYAAKCDAMYLEHFEGLTDRGGKVLENGEVVKTLLRAFGKKPTACGNFYTLNAGCLTTEIDSGFDQGSIAAGMALKVLKGTPLASLPITRNYTGKKMVNLKTMKWLGLEPGPAVLRDLKLVSPKE